MLNRRALMLEALGIGPIWQARRVSERQDDGAPPVAASGEAISAAPRSADAIGSTDSFVAAPASTPTMKTPAATPASGKHSDAEIATMDWQQLQSAVAGCTRCHLCETRNRTVFGVGDPKAQWLFIGEGPGRSEDQQGEPFVGPAGKLLDNMLGAMRLKRGQRAFIANVVKCRPTDPAGKDRAPSAEEAAACRPYLDRQITLIAPSMLVALGKTAATSLLESGPTTTLAALRGKVHHYRALPLVVTYHPAYLLRVPADKRKTWEDLCLAMAQQEGHGAASEPV